MKTSLVLCTVLLGATPLFAVEVLPLWPGETPGPAAFVEGEERDTSKPGDNEVAGKPVIRLGHVSKPEMHVFLPPKEKANGGAVVICPGGGFSILAWDLEGLEVAQWFNERGLAAAVVKYRVPTREHGEPGRWQGPVMDTQRAVSVVRHRAAEWNIDPQRIGVMGFSAGGSTAALTAVFNGKRVHELGDEIESTGCEVNFAILIYTGGVLGPDRKLRDNIQVNEKTPKMFFACAADDGMTSVASAALFSALHAVGVRSEMHVYAAGGHGFGMRPSEQPVSRWPDRLAEWLKVEGFSSQPE